MTGVSKVSDVWFLPGYIGINLNLKPIADDGEFVNRICPGTIVEGGGGGELQAEEKLASETCTDFP